MAEPVPRNAALSSGSHWLRQLGQVQGGLRAEGTPQSVTLLGRSAPLPSSAVDLVKEMERNGFHLETEHTFLPYQYFLVFKAR
jgi:hypothetical protein